MKDAIIVKEVKISDNNSLLFRLSYSNGIKQYFRSDSLVVQYDKDISNVEPSILQIPAVASIVTVAWALGSDVYVKTLDRAYLEALSKVKSVMDTWYPWLSFSTEINIDSIAANKLNNNGYGLLFTGGLDSTVSYLRHRNRKPSLIAVWGTKRFIQPWTETAEKRLLDFAKKEGVGISFVRTNFEEVTNFDLLHRKFGLEWWMNVFHSTILTGLSAPLTCIEDISTLLIASTFSKGYDFPWGSHPFIDNNIRWADVEVIHDGFELSRQEKIRHVLREYVLETGDHPFIRTCIAESGSNCGKCEKCLRTITGLVLENIDPNKCGFNNVNAETFYLIKNLVKRLPRTEMSFIETPFHKGGPKNIFRSAIDGLSLKDFDNVNQVSALISNTVRVVEWTDIQKHIPEEISHNLIDSKAFYEWFKSFDIHSVKKTEATLRYLSDILMYIYYHLPKKIRARGFRCERCH